AEAEDGADDAHRVVAIGLAAEHLALAQASLAEALRERDQVRLAEPREEADVPQKPQEIGRRVHRSRPARLGDFQRIRTKTHGGLEVPGQITSQTRPEGGADRSVR